MEWIDVNEKQPEFDTSVLTFISPDTIQIGYLNKIEHHAKTSFYEFSITGGDWHTTEKVTHWMPLPQPPKPKV